MKDSIKPCQHILSNDMEYKEVVIIGNGPSGMVTSFMLAGNVPYLTKIPDDLPIDDMLRARLSNLPAGQSLYETDLLELAEGLEGRSQNPIPLLMDNLLRPCADLGVKADPLIEWKYDVEKQIEHIVLGRGPPGGAWHSFPARVLTLSPAAWLCLPPHRAAAATATARLPARAVAEYCARYVHACNLTRYFRSGVVVTSVRPWLRSGPPCGPTCPLAANYCVSGYDTRSGRSFRYAAARVVAASGAARAATLQPHVARHALHALARLERALRRSPRRQVRVTQPPVLIVGSGVSAADAVWLTLRANLHALHLHRTPAEALARLSPQTYPDYCQVYKMMCEGLSGNYSNYTSYPKHVIVDVTPDSDDGPNSTDAEYDIRPKRVKLLNLVTNEIIEVVVSIIAILIGSKPDLFFLQTNFTLDCIELDCVKCTEEKRDKRKIEERRQSFLKDHWHYLKSVLGQSIQICKSRWNYNEINGNTDTKCALPNCNERTEKCTCNLINKYESVINNCKEKNGEFEYDPAYKNCLEAKFRCQCDNGEPYSNGIGFGIDPKKPVDGRSNPVAIDKSTHELLYAPKGIYALGPLTADNFVRFIPGGALALVTHIHKEREKINAQ
ncbi:LOW QUALITY PROTEIN: oxidative stress-induced growth inhibitor 1 [Aphomia sociella]